MFGQDTQMAWVYISGNLLRLDISPSDVHTIYTEDTLYHWVGNEGQMVSLELLERLSAETGQPYQSVEEARAAAEQENGCWPEMIDESLFIPPESVEFSDMT